MSARYSGRSTAERLGVRARALGLLDPPAHWALDGLPDDVIIGHDLRCRRDLVDVKVPAIDHDWSV